MKTTKQKLEQAKKLSSILVNVKDPITHERTKRYYFVLGIFQDARKQLNKELDLIRLSKVSKKEVKTQGQLYAEAMEERRAIKDASHSFPLSNVVLG